MNPRRGEVWLVDLGTPRGHEQAYERPAVVIQSDDLSRLSTLVVIPITAVVQRGAHRGTVILQAGDGGLREESVALCYQIRVLDRSRLIRRLGELSAAALAQIETTTAYVLGLAI